MRVAIMQPTYLPWLGYFALADQVDHFVLLDDVEYSHQNWQARNRIKGPNGAIWLSIPIQRKGRSGQLIKDVPIVPGQPWTRKHKTTIFQNYAKAGFIDDQRDWLCDIYDQDWERLAQVTGLVIRKLAGILGLETEISLSSQMSKGSGKLDRLVEIGKICEADEYLSPVGSYGYLGEGAAFHHEDIDVHYLHFEHPEYRQLHGDFISHLSVLDLLLNEGPASLDIIRSGERKPYTPREMAEALERGGKAHEGAE